MVFGKPVRQSGFSLLEAIAVIMVLGIIAALGSLLVAKLAPSYNTAAHAEQALAAPQAALWQIRRDFESMLVSGTGQAACVLTIHTAAVDIVYDFSAKRITRKVGAGAAVLLLDNVTPTAPATCPYAWVIGSGITPSRLSVDFSYAAGSVDAVSLPVKVSLSSFVAGPDATSITPACDLAAGGASATVSGTSLLGATTVNFGGTAGTLGVVTDTSIAVTVPAHATGLVDLATITREGISTRKNTFRFISLTIYTGVAAGGDNVVITGGGFTGATGVTFGGVAGTAFTVDSDTQISVTTPAHAAGAVDVVIQGITPACTLTGVFTYT